MGGGTSPQRLTHGVLGKGKANEKEQLEWQMNYDIMLALSN